MLIQKEIMNFYKIIVSYDGTNYNGWQEQKDVLSVVNKLKKTFVDTFNEDLSIVGASRTDAGVHALGQVARIKTNLDIDAHVLQQAWNNKLPDDILIRSCEKTCPEFHPMKNVEQKTYHYQFFLQRPLPFNARYGFYFRWDLDIEKLRECLKLFVGTHDFRSFSTGYEMDSTIRTIDNINLEFIPQTQAYSIEIKGKSFLYHMIRRIVGACLEVASRPNLQIEYIKEIMVKKNQEHTLPNAPAKGLMLYKINYK